MGGDLQVICHSCTATNRVAERRVKDSPKCGKCHKPLFAGESLELKEAIFQQVVNLSSQPLLVMFWAPWCGYCQKMLPEYKQAVASLEPGIRVATLNTEANRISAGRSAINSLPTLMMFKAGQEIARQPGALTAAQIIGWARSNISAIR